MEPAINTPTGKPYDPMPHATASTFEGLLEMLRVQNCTSVKDVDFSLLSEEQTCRVLDVLVHNSQRIKCGLAERK